MNMRVASEVLTRLREEANRAAPEECCGILLGEGNRITAAIPARNVHPAPQTHFEIDPQALVDAHRTAREGGPRVVGYYHSHPGGLAEPSATDRREAAHDGAIWAIIGAVGDVAFHRDDKDGFAPLSYRPIGG